MRKTCLKIGLLTLGAAALCLFALPIFLTGLLTWHPEKYALPSPDNKSVITIYDAQGDPADDAWWQIEVQVKNQPIHELGHCTLSRLAKYRVIKWVGNEAILVGIQLEDNKEKIYSLRIDAKGIPCI